MKNELKFTGWGDKPDFLSGKTIGDLFKDKTPRSIPKSSSIAKEPVVINKTTKDGSRRTLSTGPVYKTGGTQTQSVSNKKSVSIPQGTSIPFTAGTPDYSFPAGGGYEVDGFDGDVYDIKVQADGKYLVAGNFGTYYYNGDNYYSPYLIRLNTDGSWDSTFDITSNWDCFGGGFDNTVYTIEVQPDGKILVGGVFTQYDKVGDCSTYNKIIRLNPDATRDTSFNIGDGFTGDVYDLALQSDGKILVGGQISDYNGQTISGICRLNSNGSLDSSFLVGDNTVSFDSWVNVILIDSNDKILVGGYFNNYGGISSNYIARLNTNGTLDTTFHIGNGFDDEVYAIVIQSDNKIVVGGYFSTFDNNDLFAGHIVRINNDGSLDTLFGYGTDGAIHTIELQSNDKILAGGYITDFYPDIYTTLNVDYVIRFNADCTFDYSFYHDEMLNNIAETIVVLDGDQILIGGSFNNVSDDPAIIPFNYFGRLHNSVTEYKFTYRIEACVQPLEGETITYVVGSNVELTYEQTYSFQSLQNPSITVCGYIPEGYLYPSNEIEYSFVNSYVDCQEAYIANYKPVLLQDVLSGDLQPWIVDNKYEIGDILFVDTVVDLGGRAYFKYAATIVDFIPWDSPNYYGPVWYYLPPTNYVTYTSGDEAIEANGVIYVAESCSEQETQFPLIHKSIYDYKTILIPTGTNPVKIVVDYLPINDYGLISGGTPEIFSTIDISEGINCELGLSKVSPNGILDENFQNSGFDGNLVYTTVEQPDGKILVGGNFNDYLEVAVGNFMRINSDGSLDETFYLGQFDSYVRAIALQPDGKILVGGNFNNYNEEYAGKIIRLNSDGTIDQSFTYNNEFNGIVRAIAIQRDGKIVVGGQFSYYYDFNCEQIVRLNTDGSPDPTFDIGDGFDGGQVYTIYTESILNTPFYNNGGPSTYTETIIVGGQFTYYKGTNNIGGIVKLSSTGDILPDFGNGFNQDTGDTPRVNQILQQPDGKLIVIGGSNNGNDLVDYNGICIPQNMVRLVGDGDGGYQIDNTFIPYPGGESGDCGPDYDAGFYGAVLSVALLPNGKYMVGGQFGKFEWDENIEDVDVPYLVRLNSDGSLDETFTFNLDDNYVNNVLLLSSGRLLVGGWFNTPQDLMLELFIGEEYVLRSFDTCDGLTSNIFLPTVPSSTGGVFSTTPITYEPISIIGLDLAYDGDYDDDNFVIVMPTPFDVTFLGTNYTSVNVSSNPYITFGDGGNPSECCFDIPNEIPTITELPGVYLSFQCPNDPGNYDGQMYQLYTGLTDGGNTMVIKFVGSDHCDDIATLVYGFKFYKDNSDYFDLIIENNDNFFNDDPTGGVSNGVDETWVTTFDSTGGNAYRIGSVPVVSKPIKANINDRVVECGTVGDIITTPQTNGSIGGSMYFDGNSSLVTINPYITMDLNYGPWTVEWLQKYTSTDTCCRRVFDIGQNPGEEFGVSIENGDTIILWLASGATTISLNTPVYDTWSYFAISSENLGGTSQVIRVYQDGVIIYSGFTNVDINNFQGDPTVNLPLVLGGGDSGTNSLFKGYITNFRWTKGVNYYNGGTIDVPIHPLGANGSQLLFLSTDETGLIVNSSESSPYVIPANQISATGVTWSSESPFINYNFSLYTSTNTTSYNDCETCLSDFYYTARVLVRDIAKPDYVKSYSVTQQTINNLQTLGPIMTNGGPECYEVLTYFK